MKHKMEIQKNFKNHSALMIVDEKDVQVMDWKVEGSSMYAIRYVINRNHLIVSGDLGEAIFNLTWNPKFTDEWTESVDYLLEKLSCWSEINSTWSIERAEKDIKEWYLNEEQSKDNNMIYNIFRDCLDLVEYSGLGAQWHFFILLNDSNISNLYPDYLEIFKNFGKVVPQRFYYWIEGLRMASRQLRVNEIKFKEEELENV